MTTTPGDDAEPVAQLSEGAFTLRAGDGPDGAPCVWLVIVTGETDEGQAAELSLGMTEGAQLMELAMALHRAAHDLTARRLLWLAEH